MSRHLSHRLRSLRILLVTFALLLVSTLAVSADALIPAVSTGGSGGGGAASVDETAFTGIAPAEMPTVGVATAGGDAVAGAYDELLAGSGYESPASQANAPTVAESRGAERVTTPPSQEDVLAGSGYEQEAITVASAGGESADTLDEMVRSQELIALTPGNSIATSSSDDTLTPATASFEDMKVAQHDALAAAELEVATDRNTRSIALTEDKTPVALAGGNELAQAPRANGVGATAF